MLYLSQGKEHTENGGDEMKTTAVLKKHSKLIVETAKGTYGEYDFSEHITQNLGSGDNMKVYEAALAALIAADDFEAALKKAGKVGKYRELSDYDDEQIRDWADDMLHFQGVDLLEA
jgi:hypothetical protein